jgi:hypothetical protein
MTRPFETTTVHGTLYDYPKYYDLVFGEDAGLVDEPVLVQEPCRLLHQGREGCTEV